MIYLLLSLLLLTNAGLLWFLWRQWVSRRSFIREFRAFMSPKAPGETSPFADVSQVFADMMGRGITSQLKTTFMNQESVNTRSGNALINDIQEHALSNNPAVAGLLTSVPALRKSLRRNPGLMDLVVQTLANRGLFSQSVSSGNHEDAKFHL